MRYRVVIKKSNRHEYWYSRRIGQEFIVKDFEERLGLDTLWEITEHGDLDGLGLLKKDCRVLGWMEPKTYIKKVEL
jgi:hypothetical protein